MLRHLLIIGAGGFLGSISRYLTVYLTAKKYITSFPLGTFLVNMIGCLLIGVIFGFAQKYSWLNTEWKLFLAVGFCGGYTTFSSFAFENVELLQYGQYRTFIFYTVASIIIGLLAVFGGLLLTKIIDIYEI